MQKKTRSILEELTSAPIKQDKENIVLYNLSNYYDQNDTKRTEKIDLITSDKKNGISIFNLLEEQCIVPKGSSEGFYHKINNDMKNFLVCFSDEKIY